MRKEYELTIIVQSQLSEEKSREILEKYEGILLGDDGEIVVKSDWGVKKMAFPIKKQFRGHYHFYDFLANPANLAEAERVMRIDEDVLRYMLINIGEDADVDVRKAEIAKAEAAAAANRQAEIV